MLFWTYRTYVMDQFTDSVNTSVKEMYELLDEIWLSVGYSQEERGQILDQILIDIDSLCLQKLEEEQKARESIKEDLLRTKDAIEDICQRMGQEAPDVCIFLFFFSIDRLFLFTSINTLSFLRLML